jgi:tRNA A-37 threonylcarbamoyl transferase component Bud32
MMDAEKIQAEAEPEHPIDELAPGTQLANGAYTIVQHLKSGGFGITYLANDTLGRRIVIKECFPGGMCVRQTRMVRVRSKAHASNVSNLIERFVAEAHSMAKITHPNVVRVHQVFKENDTAYMALDYVEGHDLLDIMHDPSLALSPAGVRSMLLKLLDAIGTVHDAGVLHRDISPDNIVLDRKRNPVLIDFGAARERDRPTQSAVSTLHVVKDGYSPQELYLPGGGDQGPWSDLYSLAATFYQLISGEPPENSQARLAALASNAADPCVPLVGRFPEYDAAFLAAIDKAMSVLPKERLQSARRWTAAITDAAGTVTHLPVAEKTRPVTPMTRVTRMEAQAARKNTRPAMLVGGVAVVAVIAVGVYLAMPSNTTATVAGVPADFAAASPKASSAKPAVATTSAPADPAPAAASVAPVAPEASPAAEETVVRSEVSALSTNWTVEVPFAADHDNPTTIATVSGPVPDWLVPGVQIVAVNGTSVGNLAEIPAVLRETQTPAGAPAIPATLTTVGAGGTADHVIDLPVVHRVVLASGAEFLVRWVDGVWRTEVSVLPDTYGAEMRVGDIILGHVSTNTRMDSPIALKEAFESEIIAGNRSTKLAIQQGGQMWVVTFTLPG